MGRGRAAAAGTVAAALALALTELVAGLVRPVPSLLVTVGDAFIEAVPGPLVEAAIATLGTYNRPVLFGGMLMVAAAAGAGLGVVGRRRWPPVMVGYAGFAAIGTAAAAGDAQAATVPAGVAAVVGAVAGVATLRGLLSRGVAPDGDPDDGRSRRRFLVSVTTVAGVAVAAAAAGRSLVVRSGVDEARRGVALPGADRALPQAPSGAELDVDGIAPLYTPNDDFYRIDTAFSVPRVDPAGWRMRVTGMVGREREFTYDELLGMPQVEADVTLACVSNEVGGGLIGNARWRGVWLPDILREAGIDDGADQVVGRAVDGWTAGFPVEAALDGRDALVALAMNGEPLPLRHGFPARLVIAGLYGYVSDTKWLDEIELTTFDAFDAYWVPRGWAERGPIKTQSRIDVPRAGATVEEGIVAVAGVAWAGVRGVRNVEVRVDDQPWSEARLAAELGVDTWRQWVYEWPATPGRHTLRVRATDGGGETQTAERSNPPPDGATGHHTIEVDVA